MRLQNGGCSLCRVVLSILLFFFYVGLAQAEPSERSVESATWRFELDNDVFFGKDNQITSGLSLQRHSAVAENWDALGGIGRWGRVFPSLTKEGLVYRSGIAVTQVVQTPEDLSRSDLIENDVPYAGALTLQSSWYAFSDDEVRGFDVVVGVVGPLSLAEQTQKTVHKWIDGIEPKGWDNQLSSELVLNLTYMRKKKIWRLGNPSGISFDAAINGDIGVGNLFTHAGASLEMRWGCNMARGFMLMPNPIGLDVYHMASLKPVYSEKASFYASLVLRGHLFVHNIFRDGNTFHDSHSVDKEPLVGQVIGGLHYERRRWGIHFNGLITADTVNSKTSSAAENGERLGTVVIEWRF